MVLNPQELSLNIKPTFIPKTISDFLGELSTIRNVSEKLLNLDRFIKRLEDEMRKIDAFKRELPLSVLLITDAITALKEELNQYRKTNVEPVFEEFIPLKKSTNEAEKDAITNEENDEKKNWLRSVHLWNNVNDVNARDGNIKPSSLVELVKKSEQNNDANMQDVYEPSKGRAKGTAFMPFKGGSAFPVAATRKEDKEVLPVTGLSLVTPGISKPRVELRSSVVSSKSSSSIAVSSSNPNDQSNCWTSSQTSRKPRRCWSPELHRRFVSALQQLGGSQAATPKLIRELMQVDGLTNDEVKSHLQKYRLHTRRSRTNKSVESALTLGSDLLLSRDGESSEQTHSMSSSPEGPVQWTDTTRRTSTTVCDSKEDEADERSVSYNWKRRVQASGRVAV